MFQRQPRNNVLTHKIKLQRTKSIKKPIKFQVLCHCVTHAVFSFETFRFSSVVRFIFRPVQISDLSAVAQKKEISFFAQVSSAGPKMFGGLKFKIWRETKFKERLNQIKFYLCCWSNLKTRILLLLSRWSKAPCYWVCNIDELGRNLPRNEDDGALVWLSENFQKLFKF